MDDKPKAYSYIRFSTPEQEKGDSLRRQESEARKYAEEHGLTLDENQKYKDLGKSGYKGFNRINGALRDFLNLVDSGNIPKGSVLIVEHLDRLSREKVSDALTLFMNLIHKGIRIATLQDNKEYDKDSIDKNPTELLISIILMSAAHDESLKKSIRAKKTIEEKIKKLQNKEIRIFTKQCPLWLEYSDDKSEFVPIPEVCEAIKLIFKKKLEGKGSYKIQRELNSDPNVWKPPVSKKNKSGGWRDGYIDKILRSRRVIGEFQPHENKTIKVIEDGREIETTKRVAVGDSIKNYYPKIMDEGTFFRVQEIIKQNSTLPGNAGGGNKDKAKNLFSNIAKCGICGSTMQYMHTGKNVWNYLVCDSAKRKNKVQIRKKQNQKQINARIAAKLNRREIKNTKVQTTEMVCPAKNVPYNEFEKIFFENFEELDFNKLLPDGNEATKLRKVKENELSKNNFELEKLKSQIDSLLEMSDYTGDEENKKMYEQKTTEKRTKRDKLLIENKKLEQEIDELSEQRLKLKRQKDSIKEVYSFLESIKDEQELIDRRIQLRQEIKNMVEWIKIYSLQDKYKEYEEIEPGIIRHMASKRIDKIRIKFRGSNRLRAIFLNSAGEVID